MKQLREEISKVLREVIIEALPNPQQTVAQEPQQTSQVIAPNIKTKPKAVRFNKGMENEYIVTFSERGFLIDDTRLSFEEIQNALSKEYTITLKEGTILDAVKMQQIMKYKGVI